MHPIPWVLQKWVEKFSLPISQKGWMSILLKLVYLRLGSTAFPFHWRYGIFKALLCTFYWFVPCQLNWNKQINKTNTMLKGLLIKYLILFSGKFYFFEYQLSFPVHVAGGVLISQLSTRSKAIKCIVVLTFWPILPAFATLSKQSQLKPLSMQLAA